MLRKIDFERGIAREMLPLHAMPALARDGALNCPVYGHELCTPALKRAEQEGRAGRSRTRIASKRTASSKPALAREPAFKETVMADQRSRGGKKQTARREPQGKKHQGVRPGTTAREKERENGQQRRPVVPRTPSGSGGC